MDRIIISIIALSLTITLIATRCMNEHESKRQHEQIKQLTKIAEDCGAIVAVDEQGNYTAVMPLTKEEVIKLWNEAIADIEQRKKQQLPKSNTKPSKLCPKCGVYEVQHEDIGVCPNCEAGNPRFVG